MPVAIGSVIDVDTVDDLAPAKSEYMLLVRLKVVVVKPVMTTVTWLLVPSATPGSALMTGSKNSGVTSIEY